jgi:glycosyltransferase involved in cell wall biosynthesis
MSPRTVVVLPAWYPTASKPLAGPFVRDHARAAAAAGHRVIVIVNEGERAGLRGLYELSNEERDEGLRVVRLTYRPRMGTFAYVPAVLAVARRLRREGTPVDVLHAHIHWMAWPAMIVGAILRRPFVVTENSSEWPRRTMRRGAVLRARAAFRRAALVTPVSAALQRAIEAYGVRAQFRVVPNTVDTRLFHPAFESKERAQARLVNVALHVEVKALDVLLRAFAQVAAERSALTLTMIGDGPLTPDLKRLASELGVDSRVHFAGRAEPSEIARALRQADVFVLSSLSENMPLAVLEALSCGVPVVATNVGGVPEAVGGDGVLAPPGDAEKLAHAIESVLRSDDRFDRSDIAQRADKRWSLEAIGSVWDEIYCSL